MLEVARDEIYGLRLAPPLPPAPRLDTYLRARSFARQDNRIDVRVELSISQCRPGEYLPRLCSVHARSVAVIALIACPPAQLGRRTYRHLSQCRDLRTCIALCRQNINKPAILSRLGPGSSARSERPGAWPRVGVGVAPSPTSAANLVSGRSRVQGNPAQESRPGLHGLFQLSLVGLAGHSRCLLLGQSIYIGGAARPYAEGRGCRSGRLGQEPREGLQVAFG